MLKKLTNKSPNDERNLWLVRQIHFHSLIRINTLHFLSFSVTKPNPVTSPLVRLYHSSMEMIHSFLHLLSSPVSCFFYKDGNLASSLLMYVCMRSLIYGMWSWTWITTLRCVMVSSLNLWYYSTLSVSALFVLIDVQSQPRLAYWFLMFCCCVYRKKIESLWCLDDLFNLCDFGMALVISCIQSRNRNLPWRQKWEVSSKESKELFLFKFPLDPTKSLTYLLLPLLNSCTKNMCFFFVQIWLGGVAALFSHSTVHIWQTLKMLI